MSSQANITPNIIPVENKSTEIKKPDETKPAETKLENHKEKYPKIKVKTNVYADNSTGKYIYYVFHMMMSFIAVYLSFRCNGKFYWSSFLASLICPYIYIIYILATKGTCGILE